MTTYALQTLVTFTGTANGKNPYAGLVADSAGNLYGTTQLGGASNAGTVFEIVKGSGALQTLATFTGTANGRAPEAALIADSAGNLYGTTVFGGASNDGTVFEIVKSSGALQTLATFTGTANGADPYAGLTTDSAGNLYGTTQQGGAYGYGTVFEIVKNGGALQTLYSFTGGNDGAYPAAGLFADSAGNLYGKTEQGATSDVGSVFEYVAGTGALQTLASIPVSYDNPAGGLVADSAGNLYGTTEQGGASDVGTVFEIVKSTGALQTLATVTGRNGGAEPEGGLVVDKAGNVYGTTVFGGVGDGTVFEIVKGTGALQTLFTFTGTANGDGPVGDLSIDSYGNLYGTTVSGGASNDGTVFELVALPTISGVATATQGATSEAPVTPFSTVTVSTPDEGGADSDTLTITQSGTGTLSGTGLTAGATAGTYTLTGTAASITTQLDALVFTPVDGVPNTAVTTSFTLQAADTTAGTSSTISAPVTVTDTDPAVAPTITREPPASYNLATLVTFTGTTNGTRPTDGFIADGAGNLYGTTAGTVFEIAKSTGALQTLATFTGPNGSGAQASLYADSAGNLYGTTDEGGASSGSGDYGTVFEIVKSTGALQTLVNFNRFNGSLPNGGLIADSAGNLYGTTFSGGPSGGDGTVFEVVKSTGALQTLVTFTGANGAQPLAGLTADSAGNLYGTTVLGGTSDFGTVFEVVKSTGMLQTLATFTGANGSEPYAGLVVDGAGNLYGTTKLGGGSGKYGTVFEIVKSTGALQTLATFNGANGYEPEAGLVVDSAGDLYGTLYSDFSNNGAIFEIVKSTGALQTLATFTGANGANPVGGLIVDSTGKFYGTTNYGGASNDGTAFQLSPVFVPVTTTSEAPVAPFSGVTIGDANGGGATDMLTITVGGSGGALAGTGLTGGTNGVYTLTGTAAAITADLDALLFTPTGTPNTSSTSTFTLSDTSTASTTPATDNYTTVVDTDPAVAPTITGLVVANQASTSEATVTPFAAVTLADTNNGGVNSDTLTITQSGTGMLSGTGLTAGAGGTYTLTGTAAAIAQNLDALIFTPVDGVPNTAVTTSFTLQDVDATAAMSSATSAAVTVIDSDPAVAPTISGVVTATQATTSEATVTPFSTVTVSDTNDGGTNNDTLTITQSGTGTLSGTGLTAGASGTYTLTGTAAAITSNFNALIFTPVDGVPNTAVTTSFTLQDIDATAAMSSATSAAVTVNDSDPAVAPTITGVMTATQATTSEATVTPFSTVTVADANNGGTNTDTLTITQTGTGTLSGTGLTAGASGTYTLTGTAAAIAANLDALIFTPVDGVPNTAVTTSFTLTDADATAGTSSATSASVLVSDSDPAVAPTIIRPPAASYGLTTLATFNGIGNGANPYSGLTLDGAGNLYGTTAGGGASNDGAVFEIVKSTGTLQTLATFTNNDQYPQADLIADSAGNLYGTTTGGAYTSGTVFEIVKSTGALQTLANFNGDNGASPQGSLIADSAGNLYGTTGGGGASDDGTVFEIVKSTGALQTLATFTGGDGANPEGGLTADSAGNLYGTTPYGGRSEPSTVFEFVKSTGALQTLTTLTGSSNAGLILDSAGNLYGTSVGGGNSGDGFVFEFVKSTGALQTLATFTGANGSRPYAGLTADGAGNLYGTTHLGGASQDGTVFEIVKSTGALQTLANFTGGNGLGPTSGLTFDGAGDLYGTTQQGGASNDGTVFELSPTLVTTTSEAPVAPFSGVTIGDANGGGATDMLTITVGGSGGALAGTGLTGGTNGVYTLTGTAAAITADLDALLFTPTGTPNTSSTSTFTLSDTSTASTTPATDNYTTVVDTDPAVAPTITGLVVANQASTSEATVTPFAAVTLADTNNGGVNSDTLTITQSGTGMLSGTGLTAGAGGTYTLTGTAAAIAQNLDALIFTPVDGVPNTAVTTSFTLQDVDATAAMSSATSAAVTVIDSDPAVAPTISGVVTATQATTSEATVTPFSTVTVSDTNDGGTNNDTLTITQSGTGTLSGTGLTAGASGTYTLTGTAAAITSNFNALIFTPVDGVPNTAVTTSFTLQDIDATAAMSSATSAAVTVNDSDPAVAPTITGVMTATQATTSEATVTPFSTVTVADANNGGTNTDTLTITQTGTGTLSGTGLTAGASGTYTLTGTAAAIAANLDALIFTPVDGVPNTAVTTSFTLTDADATAGTSSATSASVLVSDSDPAVAPTITGTIANQATSSEMPISPFAAVSVGDPNANATVTVADTNNGGANSDTLTITQTGTGTLSGTGLGAGAGGTYTLTGTAAAITQNLDALVFTPVDGVPNTAVTTSFTLQAADATAGTSSSMSAAVAVTDSDPAAVPTIAGIVTATQATTSEAPVTPFATVTVADTNNGGANNDTLTITQTGAGTLSGTGLVAGAGGTYTLTGTAAAITQNLDALVFTPVDGVPNTAVTTSFTLQAADATAGTSATMSAAVTVTDSDPAAVPTIAGIVTATQATTSEAPVTPFATVTVADTNNGGANNDTLTITQTGAGTLSGTGLVAGAGGTYTLTGTAAAITQNLDALVFTPVDGVPNTAVTTSFTLQAADATAGTSSSMSAAVTVTDSDPAAVPTITLTSTAEASTQATQTISGTVVSGGTTPLTGQTVTFSDNGVAIAAAAPVAVQSDGTFSASVTLPNQGANSIVASVTDGYGNVGSSVAVVDTLATAMGVAEDGYIAGASLFADANGNGLQDAGEAVTTTDANGNFTLVGGSGPLVLIGGTDITTGLALTGKLEAPAGSSVVSPLTTIVQIVASTRGISAAAANTSVASSLGLSAGTDLTTLDAQTGAMAGNPVASAVFVAQTQVANTFSLITAAGGSLTTAAAQTAIASAFTSGSSVLTNATLLSGLAMQSGVGVAAAAVGQIGSAANALIAKTATDGSSSASIVKTIAAVASVTQGAASTNLGQTAGNPTALLATTAAYTGNALVQATTQAGGTVSAPSISLLGSGGTVATTETTISGTVDLAHATGTVHLYENGTAVGLPVAVSAQGTFETTISFPSDGTYAVTATKSSGTTLVRSNAVDITLNSKTNQSLFGAVTHNVTSVGGSVYALYEAILGRAPDPTGFENVVASVQAGSSLSAIAQGILSSGEYTADYGSIAQTSDDAFITQLYQNGLGRSPDAGGLQTWENALEQQGLSRTQVAIDIATSPEAQGDLASTLQSGVFVPSAADASIARLYYGLLDRAPDTAGLQNAEQAVASGASLTQVAQGFLGSAEYQTTAVGQSNLQFIQGLYQTALGRTGDAAGVQNWETALDTGTVTRADVVTGFLGSPEFQADTAGDSTDAYINQVYQVALGRTADPSGLQNWESAFASGLSRTSFDQDIVASAEFQANTTSPSQAAFVNALYEGALGRAAEPGGLATFQGALTNGASAASVVLGIVESPEAQAHLAPKIEAGFNIA